MDLNLSKRFDCTGNGLLLQATERTKICPVQQLLNFGFLLGMVITMILIIICSSYHHKKKKGLKSVQLFNHWLLLDLLFIPHSIHLIFDHEEHRSDPWTNLRKRLLDFKPRTNVTENIMNREISITWSWIWIPWTHVELPFLESWPHKSLDQGTSLWPSDWKAPDAPGSQSGTPEVPSAS